MENIPSQPPYLNNGNIRPDAKDETLEFYWDYPLHVGLGLPPPVDSFILSTYSTYGGTSPISYTLNPSTFYLKISSLTNDTQYAFQITASNAYGVSAPAYFRTVQPGFVPNPVSNPTATVISTSAVQIGWDGPTPDVNIPSTGWFVVESISSSSSDPEIRISAYESQSTAVISSLNTASMYSFNVYAVNDPGYSLAVSTIAVSPVIGGGDLYTYFNIVTISGSNHYYYTIYNSQTGWGAPVDTGLNASQYSYMNNNNGGGSNYLFGTFYNSNTSTYAIPFVNTSGIALDTITWNAVHDNGFVRPNSYSNDTMFAYSSNLGSGIYDLQLYQPDTGLYQLAFIKSEGTFFGSIYPIPLQNSEFFLAVSSYTYINYLWDIHQSSPTYLFESYYQFPVFGQSEPVPVNSNTGIITTTILSSPGYYDTVCYITEPSTLQQYALAPDTYTNYYNDGTFGNNNQNAYRIMLYNNNTTYYDIYIWNNFSNFQNPVILSNIGSNGNTFNFISRNDTTYEATYTTNVLLFYTFDTASYNSGAGIGTTYTILPNGSVLSSVYTSTTVALTNTNFQITSNGSGVLEFDSIMNNINLNLCTGSVGQTSIFLSSASAYLDNLSTLNNYTYSYTNFFSLNLPLANNVDFDFITIQSDTGAITTRSTNTGINSNETTYSGSTGMVLYSNGSCDVLFNGVITSNIPNIDIVSYPQPDFASGIMSAYYYDGAFLNIYIVYPDTSIVSSVTELATTPSDYATTPSGFFAYINNPFTVIAQAYSPESTSIYTVAGSNSNTIEYDFYPQEDSAMFNVYDFDTNSTISLVFSYSNTTFHEYTEQNSIVRSPITTSPYGWFN
jgi:hypothetical protein